MRGTLRRCGIALVAICAMAGGAHGATKPGILAPQWSACEGLPWQKAPAVRYHATDSSTHLIARLSVSVEQAERGLHAATTDSIGISPYHHAVGDVLIPERGRFSLESQAPSKKCAAACQGGDVGASGYRELQQRSFEPGERRYELDPHTTGMGDKSVLAYWKTNAYTTNDKPMRMASHFVLALRPVSPTETELGVYQYRVRIFTGRRITIGVHSFEPYVACQEHDDDRPVPEDLDVVMQWARNAIYMAPPGSAK